MKNWEKKKLGDICEFVRGPFGGSLKKNIFKPDGFAVYEQQHAIYDQFDDIRYFIDENKFNEMKRFELKAGDLIMSCSGTMGKVAIVPNEFKKGIINQALLKISPSNKISNVFLKLWMQSESFQESLKNYSGGAAIQNVASVAILKGIEIPLPTISKQQRIVSILDECFAAIDKAKANAEQNLKNAKELFESYLENLFTEIYNSNETKTISELSKVIGGYSFKSGDFKKEGKYQVIRMGNVRPGIIRENESPVFINELDEKALAKALLQRNDVIITQTGTKKKRDYGFTVIIEKENYLLNQRIAAIRFSEKYLPKFFLYFSWTNLFKDQYFANETGTVGQGNVGIGAITDAKVPFIKIKQQEEFISKIDVILAETERLGNIYQKKLNDLDEMKKSILQKAFAGELKTEKAVAV
jgi:type I restriction enzyme S subunit